MRPYPLFIIDTSRSHGRGREVDYIACTSTQLPWVGEVTYLAPEELAIDQDWQTKNPMCIYSEPHPKGSVRAKIKILNAPAGAKAGDLRQLLRRALKEWYIRQNVVTVTDLDNPTNEAIVKFCDVLIDQNTESLRENPADRQCRLVQSILTKIKNDYASKK